MRESSADLHIVFKISGDCPHITWSGQKLPKAFPLQATQDEMLNNTYEIFHRHSFAEQKQIERNVPPNSKPTKWTP